MRKLMWFGVGFAAACLLCAYLFMGVWPLLFGIAMALIALGGLLFTQAASAGKRFFIVVLGVAVGLLWYYTYSTLHLSAARQADGTSVDIQAQVTDYSYETKFGAAAEADIYLAGNTYHGRIYYEEDATLSPGDRIEGSFRLRYTGPNGDADSEYLSGNGVYLLAYQKDELSIRYMQDRSLRHFPARLRASILQKLDESFPADTLAFAKALLLGDRRDMDYETTASLTSSGIIHLVAVSGLHVSVLFSLLYGLLGRRRILTPLLGTVVLLFVASVTGFTPSVVRACLMNWLMVMALVVNKESDGPTSLAFAVTVMLVVNPLSVTSVGLQLSVASVVGLMAFSAPIHDRICSWRFWASAKRRTVKARLRNFVASSVGTAIGASLATAPLTALHFGTVSLIGLLTNLLTVSVANIVFVLLILCVAIGFVWASVGSAMAWVLSWPIRYILFVSRLLSSVPAATVYTRSVYVLWWMIFSYAALGVFYLGKCKELRQLLVTVSLTLCVALGLSYLEPRLDLFRITVLDVGQGQCVLLQSEGKTYMVDCGGDRDEDAADTAIKELFSQGVFHLDGLIITHYDSDHMGGVPYLLSRIEVGSVYLPQGSEEEPGLSSALSLCQIDAAYVDRLTRLQCNGATITIYPSDYLESSNESSLCVLFQKDNYDILITGDRTVPGEADLMLKYDIPPLDALLAGHHGAASSTSDYLLSRTRPTMVLISAGEDNRYGHPAPALLERLERYGCIVRRTDLEGTIIIRR